MSKLYYYNSFGRCHKKMILSELFNKEFEATIVQLAIGYLECYIMFVSDLEVTTSF